MKLEDFIALGLTPEAAQKALDQHEASKKTDIEAAVAAEVDGLKSKNADLIDKFKKARDAAAKFEGLDVDALLELQSKAKTDEEKEMLAQGKFAELLKSREDEIKTQLGEQVTIAQDKAKAAEDELAALKTETSRLNLHSTIGEASATIPDFLPTALPDLQARSERVFKTIEGQFVAFDGDKQLYNKDSKPMSQAEWIESQRETSPHMFGKAKGTGAPGSDGNQKAAPSGIGTTPEEHAQAVAARTGLPLN